MAAVAEAGIRALLAKRAPSLDADVVDYMIGGLADAAADAVGSESVGPMVTAELVAEIVGPFLEEHLEEAQLADLCRHVAVFFCDGNDGVAATTDKEDAAETENVAAAASVAAAGNGSGGGRGIRIGDMAAATVDISQSGGPLQ